MNVFHASQLVLRQRTVDSILLIKRTRVLQFRCLCCRSGSVDVNYDMLFLGDVNYENSALESQLKNSLSNGNLLGNYVLDSNSVDVSGKMQSLCMDQV